ncbi:MAG: LacI family DNA-binding transcriptional regulator [Austwickia sp.]|nr:LacI family DNA-binding transcriptional regulator [Austwickia sp.]
MNRPRVRLLDVAMRAGVSPAAASMALNGRSAGNLAPTTRDRILAAAAELDYTPDSVAQSLRRRKTNVLGLVTDAIASSPFAGRLLAGAMESARTRSYVLVIVDANREPDNEVIAIRELTRRRVDGLVYATMGLQHLPVAPHTSLPLVLANCWSDQPVPAVIPDDDRAGDTAAAYLTGLGHQRVAMITGLVGSAGQRRTRAFTERSRDAGVDPLVHVIDADWSVTAGYHAAWTLLTDDTGAPRPAAQRPTAVWGVNDRVATGVVLAALRLGLEIPRDLSVLGMDDQEELADCLVPALTTLALPHRELGEAAVSRLLDLLDNSGLPVPADPQRLECPLVERASTAPPPSAG